MYWGCPGPLPSSMYWGCPGGGPYCDWSNDRWWGCPWSYDPPWENRSSYCTNWGSGGIDEDGGWLLINWGPPYGFEGGVLCMPS